MPSSSSPGGDAQYHDVGTPDKLKVSYHRCIADKHPRKHDAYLGFKIKK